MYDGINNEQLAKHRGFL